MLNPAPSRNIRRGRQRGLSIVEMMVGIAVGLIIVAAATMMVAAQLGDNRRLMLETQMQQDLRAAADLMARDLRRASYWKSSALGTAAGNMDGVWQENPNAAVELPTPTNTETSPRYRYSDPNAASASSEQHGFRLSNNTIQTELGSGNWQPITDPNVIKITRFDVRPIVRCVSIAPSCAASAACPPYQQVRNVTIEITGQAVHEPKLERSIRTQVRIRNDAVVTTSTCEELP